MIYNFSKDANLAKLTTEIRDSAIVTALESVSTPESPSEIVIKFKADLSAGDLVILAAIVDAHINSPSEPLKTEVITQMEKNDKTLRAFWAMTETDSDGVARVQIPIPVGGRFIGYGDAEFKVRDFGDYVSKIEISDLDRGIAWMLALSIDPGATEPLSDTAVRAMISLPTGEDLRRYPVMDHYDEKDLPTIEDAPSSMGTIKGGIAMTFTFGVTEVQPIGGYGDVPGQFYLVLEAVKDPGAANRVGIPCKFSIDGAKRNET